MKHETQKAYNLILNKIVGFLGFVFHNIKLEQLLPFRVRLF